MQRKKEVSSIATSYVHCLTQGFFFVIGRCVPLVVFLYSCLPHNKCWQRVNTHIHNNGQSTCELSHGPDKSFCYLSFLFPYSQTFRRLLTEDRFQPDRRVSSFSWFLYIVFQWRQHSGVRLICVLFLFINGSSLRLKVKQVAD